MTDLHQAVTAPATTPAATTASVLPLGRLTGTTLTLPLGLATAFRGLGGVGVLEAQRRRRKVEEPRPWYFNHRQARL